MMNRHHWLIFLCLVTCGVLVFVDQNSFKSCSLIQGAKFTFTPAKALNLLQDSEFHSAATGYGFTGDKIRTFTKYVFQDENTIISLASSPLPESARKNCEKWGVMTTISSPTEAVRRFLYKPDWCVVVVADLNKPEVRYF
jgi:hypothetical protein